MDEVQAEVSPQFFSLRAGVGRPRRAEEGTLAGGLVGGSETLLDERLEARDRRRGRDANKQGWAARLQIRLHAVLSAEHEHEVTEQGHLWVDVGQSSAPEKREFVASKHRTDPGRKRRLGAVGAGWRALIVRGFAVLGEVEAFDFFFLGDP